MTMVDSEKKIIEEMIAKVEVYTVFYPYPRVGNFGVTVQ
jgi:hypothetical protein